MQFVYLQMTVLVTVVLQSCQIALRKAATTPHNLAVQVVVALRLPVNVEISRVRQL